MIKKIKSLYRKLLPEFIRRPLKQWRFEKEFHYDAEIEFYGAYWVLRKHLGIKRLNYLEKRNINWAHGWYADFFLTESGNPYMAICNFYYDEPGRFNFVTRKTQEELMKAHGIPNTKAIGMPIIYIPKKNIRQKTNTLLVMPTHSQEGFEVQTFEDDYVALINGFRTDFDEVAILVHAGCYNTGKWINTFRKHDYKVIKGIQLNDKKSFYKMQKIMSAYEYMTTNGFGSHMMYASYFGAKVSVIGQEVRYDNAVLEKVDGFEDTKNRKNLLQSISIVTTQNYRKYYTDFYVDHPKKAVAHKAMADYELGVANKITKEEFDRIAGSRLPIRNLNSNKSNITSSLAKTLESQ